MFILVQESKDSRDIYNSYVRLYDLVQWPGLEQQFTSNTMDVRVYMYYICIYINMYRWKRKAIGFLYYISCRIMV